MDLKSSIKCGGIPSPIEVYEMGHTPMTERMDFFTGWLMGWFMIGFTTLSPSNKRRGTRILWPSGTDTSAGYGWVNSPFRLLGKSKIRSPFLVVSYLICSPNSQPHGTNTEYQSTRDLWGSEV